jgi:hypothetical protein
VFILLKLIEKGYTREDAYRIVQKHALEALNGGDFRKGLNSENLFTAEELETCFNAEDYLKNLNLTYRKNLNVSSDINFGLDMQFLGSSIKVMERCIKDINKSTNFISLIIRLSINFYSF